VVALKVKPASFLACARRSPRGAGGQRPAWKPTFSPVGRYSTCREEFTDSANSIGGSAGCGGLR
jgi:hypothetical protein